MSRRRFIRRSIALWRSIWGERNRTRELLLLLRELKPASVVHLAYVIDPQRSGVLDEDRMWRINVAGTARVMEAITEANRNVETAIRQFIFPSSVSAYGSDLPRAGRRRFPARRAHAALRNPQERMRPGGAAARALAARMRSFYFASRIFLPEPPWRTI